MEKQIFEIETENGFEQFEGITFGQRWNGWECPQFDLETTNKILLGMCSEEVAKECSFSHYKYDEFYNVVIETTFWGNKIECVETWKPSNINGVDFFAVGYMCWTWTKA